MVSSGRDRHQRGWVGAVAGFRAPLRLGRGRSTRSDA